MATVGQRVKSVWLLMPALHLALRLGRSNPASKRNCTTSHAVSYEIVTEITMNS